MANKVDTFPAARGLAAYPWEDWEDGSIWQIRHGEDFDIPVEGMSSSLYQRAKRVCKRVKVAVRDDTITFQFTDGEVVEGGAR